MVIKHILKLMWNRKRANLLILVELTATFLVIFSLVSVLVYSYRLYTAPLGFTIADKWTITVNTDNERGAVFFGNREAPTELADVRREIMALLSQRPEIHNVHTLTSGPYNGNTFNTVLYRDGEAARTRFNMVSDGVPQDIGMRLLEGRWFGPQDAGRDVRPVVINQRLKHALFGDESALGAEITDPPPVESRYRVVGVFEDFRKDGEFSVPVNYMLQRDPMTAEGSGVNLGSTFNLLVTTRGTTPGEFEETLIESLRGIKAATPISDIRVDSWAQLQRDNFVRNVSPLLVMALVAGFVIMMVAFGLFGVLWQNVIRRTREIGVRRAMGATGASVRRQITLEMTTLGAVATLVGFLLVVQLPISGYISALDWPLFWNSLIISASVLIGLAALCALYPSWLGTRMDAVDALRYE